MFIRMLTNIAGTPSHTSGEIVEKPDNVAKAWIADGLAAPVADRKDSNPVERAVK